MLIKYTKTSIFNQIENIHGFGLDLNMPKLYYMTMKKRVLILIALFSIVIMPLLNLPINIYSHDTTRNNDVCIVADVDSHDAFYLNQSHQTDFIFIADHSVSLFHPQNLPFKDNFMPHKTASFTELPYKPPLSI